MKNCQEAGVRSGREINKQTLSSNYFQKSLKITSNYGRFLRRRKRNQETSGDSIIRSRLISIIYPISIIPMNNAWLRFTASGMPIFHSSPHNQIKFGRRWSGANFIASPSISQGRQSASIRCPFGSILIQLHKTHSEMEKEFIVQRQRRGRTKGPSQIKINDWKIMAVMFLSLKQEKNCLG